MSINSQSHPEGLLNNKQAAQYLNVSARTLDRLRKQKKLPYVSLTGWSVHFRHSDLDAFIECRIVHKKAMEKTQAFIKNHRKYLGQVEQGTSSN